MLHALALRVADIRCAELTPDDGDCDPCASRAPLQANALHEFVEKEEKGALADCLSHSLAATLATSLANEETADAADRGLDLSALLRQAAAQRRTQVVTLLCRCALRPRNVGLNDPAGQMSISWW